MVTAVLATAFAWLLSRQMTEQALEQAVRNTATMAALGVHDVSPADFSPTNPQVSALWSERLRFLSHSLDIARVKMWSLDGTVIYSDAQFIIGRKFEISDELAEASLGDVTREINFSPKEENISELQYKALLEVYYPVKLNNRVVGVLELYRDFAPIQARINSIRQLVWGGSLLVFSLLFLTLFSLVRRASRQLHFMAYHDPLTGLLNRRYLREFAPKALTKAYRSGKQTALLYIDLDRFKEFNDTLGHQSGDELLKRVAVRFGQAVREPDTLCRLGGDEFALLLEEVDAVAVLEVAQRLIEGLKMPFEISGHRAHLEASIGIALYPADGLALDELMRAADVAMYQAKANGKGVVFYQANLDQFTLERLELLSALREAIQNDGFTLHYQPIVNFSASPVARCEALVRWNRAGEMVMPGKFIPLAEETGLIADLDRLVIRKATQEAAQHGFYVSVNLSARSLSEPYLASWLQQTLQSSRLEPAKLWLEITETTLMKDRERALATLKDLRELGVQIALDDFGTGYSSLAYLKHLPVDVLKMDRTFVAGIGKDARDEDLIRSVIALAKGLKLQMLAEGIETNEQLEWLRTAGCDLGQGYGIGRPAPLEKLNIAATEGSR